MKMYIRIEGDEDANGAYVDVRCDRTFLMNAIIQLFKMLLRHPSEDLTDAITCLKECTDSMEKRLKRR